MTALDGHPISVLPTNASTAVTGFAVMVKPVAVVKKIAVPAVSEAAIAAFPMVPSDVTMGRVRVSCVGMTLSVVKPTGTASVPQRR